MKTPNLNLIEIRPSSEGAPCFLRLALASVEVSLAEADALAAALERGETIAITWEPTHGSRHATVQALRAAIRRLRDVDAERAAAAAARQAESGARRPKVESVTEMLARKAAERKESGR